jgi:DNA-directed RNA polymerase subunit RPC12/RpoP
MAADMDEEKYICLSCEEEFSARAIKPNRWDDYPCPACGSLRIERVRTRLERLYAFLMQYNRN